jgi:hypothetical protein
VNLSWGDWKSSFTHGFRWCWFHTNIVCLNESISIGNVKEILMVFDRVVHLLEVKGNILAMEANLEVWLNLTKVGVINSIEAHEDDEVV